jgi:hypothetical protein
MGMSRGSLFLGLALILASICTATAQGPAAAKSEIDALKGAWVRPDGGYTIAIKGIGPNGQLEAMYLNPNPGGYGGSTYELTYDPASDRLKGTYYQPVAKQKFDVYFARK